MNLCDRNCAVECRPCANHRRAERRKAKQQRKVDTYEAEARRCIAFATARVERKSYFVTANAMRAGQVTRDLLALAPPGTYREHHRLKFPSGHWLFVVHGLTAEGERALLPNTVFKDVGELPHGVASTPVPPMDWEKP